MQRSVLIIIWLLALPVLWVSLIESPLLRIDIGVWGDHTALSGAYPSETSPTKTFRWTMPTARLDLPIANTASRLLALRAYSERPGGTRTDLRVNQQAWGQIQLDGQLRTLQILLPEPGLHSSYAIDFTSQRYQPPGDTRPIGIGLDWVLLKHTSERSWPMPWPLLGQATLLALLLALLERCWPRSTTRTWPMLTLALGMGAGLLAMNWIEPRWISLALGGWLVTSTGLLALVAYAGPWFEQRLQPWLGTDGTQLALALIVTGLAIRLFGAVHPLLDTHDLPVHQRWLQIVTGGQLYLYSTPGELQNRLTFNPPAGYLLLAPLLLVLPEPRLVVHAGTVLIDMLGCVALLGIAYELKLPGRAALFTLTLSLALPITMTMLWWGFATNTIAQSLGLILVWLILRYVRSPTPQGAIAVTTVSMLALLTHVGVLVLLLSTLALLFVGGCFLFPRRTTLFLAGMLLVAGLVTLLFYFSAVIIPVLNQPAVPARSLAESLARAQDQASIRFTLVGNGFWIGYTVWLLALLPVGGVLLLAGQQQHLRRLLLGTWLIINLVFFGIYLALGLVTRYIYYDVPLICLCGGMALNQLARRPGGRWMTGALVLLIIWIGLAIWFGGVLLRDKPSLVPLTQ